uniref:CCHC-type domain-containing protein n=1 Tax=Amphimedon queenslandica TaxID=400682 RepID=A0A1X7TDA7_AMPQE
MARAVGNLETFDPKRHNFPKYVQRVKLYFTANDIPNARRKLVFLSALGYETYDILANVFDDQDAQTFDTLVARSLAARCRFKADALDETLCDRFVCGLFKEFIRSRLLTEVDDLPFDRAVEIAMTLEDSRRTAQLMQQWEPRKQSVQCYRCGGSHSPATCWFLKEKCHSWGKLGHISKVCRSSKAKDTKAKSQPKAQRTTLKSTHAIAEGPINSPNIEDSEEVFMVRSLTSRVAPTPVTVIVITSKGQVVMEQGTI